MKGRLRVKERMTTHSLNVPSIRADATNMERTVFTGLVETGIWSGGQSGYSLEL